MNILSVEIQPWICNAVLKEEDMLSIIGDGHRSDMPNAFSDDKWASKAMPEREKTIIGEEPFYDLYEHPEKLPFFFRNYFNKATEFLGMTEPLSRNGYQAVMVLHCADFAAQQQVFKNAMMEEGLFTEARVIPSDLALLSAWGATTDYSSCKNAVMVIIGQKVTTISAYRVRVGNKNLMDADFISQTVLRQGYINWMEEFAQLLTTQLSGQKVYNTLLLHDNMVEFLNRIRNAGGARIKWSGLYRQELADRVQLPDAELFNTRAFSFDEFLSELTEAVGKYAKTAVSAKDTRIIVSGPGAIYPLKFKSLGCFGEVIVAAGITQLIAMGGAIWLESFDRNPHLAKRFLA